MSLFTNLDLFFVGVAVAGIFVLGFIIFFTDRHSITNKSFLLFSILAGVWSTINYSYYQIHDVGLSFLFLRLVIFVGVWFVFFLFRMLYVFPLNEKRIPSWFRYILFPITTVTSILTLTPFVFEKVIDVDQSGRIAQIQNGPGIFIFAGVVLFLVFSGIFTLIRKAFGTKSESEKRQITTMSLGLSTTFALIMTFNLVLPAFFNNAKFIPLGAVFIFPFVISTAYAILKHKLFNIKIASTALLTFALTVTTFLEIIFSSDLSQIIFRSSVFVFVLVFSILLLKSVLKEVSQREKIQVLADDLSKANSSLEGANERLKELDKLKSEFVSLATHQIRSPLTAIKGYISLIQEGDYGPVSKEVSGAIDVVFQSTNNLVTIVGDFLDVSRIEQGKMKYDFKEFDIQELTHQVATELQPNVDKRGLELKYKYDKSKGYIVFADMGKVKQVIGNIIDNSIKYTPKGSVSVSITKPTAAKIQIKVSDTGVGIKPEVLPKLFQKFTRADNANEVNILGTGLGLYVAKQMIEAHGGKVWAESEGLNKGSQFYIELPVKSHPEIQQNLS